MAAVPAVVESGVVTASVVAAVVVIAITLIAPIDHSCNDGIIL